MANPFSVSGIINALNRIIEKLGSLQISIGGDPADYVCNVYCSTNQSINSGAATKVALNTKIFDPMNCFDNVTNYRYTVPVAGFYQISAQIRWNAPNAACRFLGMLYKNNAEVITSEQQCNVAGLYVTNVLVRIIYLEKGDYLEVFVYQDSGVAKTLLGGTSSFFSIAKINKYSGGTMTQNLNKFKVYKDSALTLSAGAFTKISFNKKEYDPSNLFDNVTNYRFTAAVAGWYDLSARVSLTHASLDTAIVSIFKNGAEYSRGSDIRIATASNLGIMVADKIYLQVGDYIEIQVYASHAAVIDVVQPQCYFSGHLLSQ